MEDRIKQCIEMLREGACCSVCVNAFPSVDCPYPCEERTATNNNMDEAANIIESLVVQLESAQPKWISVIDNPPNEGDVVFAHDPDEGWIALVKVIRVNLASIDVKAIWPEHSPPFIAKVWTPLRLPEPPKEEA